MKITPVKGTNDYLPAQAELRNYLQKKICETYEQAGFQRIATPIIEDIENLDKSEGGDNLNLIFKVMKRGEKLKKAIARMNEQLPNSEAKFGIHEATNRVMIKLVDKDTQEVIKEIPPEKTLDMLAKSMEIAGVLLDQKL